MFLIHSCLFDLSLRLSPSGFVRAHRGVDGHRPEGRKFLEAWMTEFLLSVNSNWKSERFEGCLAPFAAEAGRGDEVFVVVSRFCAFADFKLRESEVTSSSSRAKHRTSCLLHGVGGLRLPEGVFPTCAGRRGAAEALSLSWLWTTSISTSTCASTLRGSFST